MESVTTTMVVTTLAVTPAEMAATIRPTATATTIGGAEFPGPTKGR